MQVDRTKGSHTSCLLTYAKVITKVKRNDR